MGAHLLFRVHVGGPSLVERGVRNREGTGREGFSLSANGVTETVGSEPENQYKLH